MTRLKFSYGKRWFSPKRFYFFYQPMSKSTMKQEGFLFFYWIGPWFFACQKVR